ncbi:hypothetical protein ABZ807_22005 [Micromonospora sp. NPDC047548]|uniref:hypothetical protein n=1 Tax=Micromonospora sp. NPDC047548 TaxID=3155624 RepID=UPI0033E9D853
MDERSRVLIEELRHMRAARRMTQEDLARTGDRRSSSRCWTSTCCAARSTAPW